jgi:hypothetical protein
MSQLDGALCHLSCHVPAFLDREFPDCCTEREDPLSGPSSRFDSSGFFFWRFVRDIAYREKIQNVKELHDRTVRAAECFTDEMLAITWQDTDVCRVTNDAHIEI